MAIIWHSFGDFGDYLAIDGPESEEKGIRKKQMDIRYEYIESDRTFIVRSGPMQGLRVHLKVHSHLHGLTHWREIDKGVFKDFFGANTFTDPIESYKGVWRRWGSMRIRYHRKLNIGAGFMSGTDRYRLVRGVSPRKGALGKLLPPILFYGGV